MLEIILLIIAIYIFYAIVEENDASGGLVLVPFIIYFGYVYFAKGEFLWDLIVINVVDLAIGFGIYTILGAVWSFIKWGLFVKKKFKEFQSIKIGDTKFNIPLAGENKGYIIFHMTYWPISATYDFVFKGLVKYFKNIFLLLETRYNKFGAWLIKEK